MDGLPPGEVVDIELSAVDLDDTELEFRISHRIKDLVSDLATNGQQFPVILRKPEGRAKYQLVSGFRRCRALTALRWPTVKAIIRTDLDDDAAYRVSFLENERRLSLSALDKAHAILKLRLKGKTDNEIGEIYGIGLRQIQRLLRLTNAPDVIRSALEDGRIRSTHALVLVQKHDARGEDLDDEALAAWIDRVEAEGLSVRMLVLALNERYGKPEKKRGLPVPGGQVRSLRGVKARFEGLDSETA